MRPKHGPSTSRSRQAPALTTPAAAVGFHLNRESCRPDVSTDVWAEETATYPVTRDFILRRDAVLGELLAEDE